MYKKFWVKKIIGCIILCIVMVALLGWVVMSLWNHVLAVVLPVSAVTFWQAVGILVLSKILFGGFHGRWGGSRGGRWGKEMREKWHNMTPEEREKIKQEWRNRCRGWGRPADEQNAGTE